MVYWHVLNKAIGCCSLVHRHVLNELIGAAAMMYGHVLNKAISCCSLMQGMQLTGRRMIDAVNQVLIEMGRIVR